MAESVPHAPAKYSTTRTSGSPLYVHDLSVLLRLFVYYLNVMDLEWSPILNWPSPANLSSSEDLGVFLAII
jgi:hypothetical protein